MKIFINGLFLVLIVAACSTETVSKKKTVKPSNSKEITELTASERAIEPLNKVVEKKEFPNGIKIQWFEHGTGENLVEGSVYEINYKLKLSNGNVVDGNHFVKRDFLPFLVGYQMQTPGWDIAMKELKAGDFVEIYIPGNLARGEKGIPGKIPPNAPNILMLRVGNKINPTRVIDGVKVWCLQESAENEKIGVTDNSAIAIHYFVGTKSNPRYDNSYQRNQPFQFRMTDASLIPGLKKAMKAAHMYDKMWVLVPPNQAYGNKGYVDLVKPNEDLFYDLLIMDIDGKSAQNQ